MALGGRADERDRRRDAAQPRRQAAPLEPAALRAQRAAAERDVLACGVVLHRLLAGAPALDSADIAAVIERMAPRGREFVRLPWTTPQPIAEPLRAIVNRSTVGAGAAALSQRAHLPRRAHRLARSALPRTTAARSRCCSIACAASATCRRCPGLGARVQRVTAIESQRTDEIARHLLPDMALSFELLRTSARRGCRERRSPATARC